MRLIRPFVRVFAVVRKELREVLRRPGAVLSLVLGPILVMALFGLGFTGERRAPDLIVVIPQGSELPRDRGFYQQVAGRAANVVDVVPDANAARARLKRGEVGLVVIAPADARQTIEKGQQATVTIEDDQIDPTAHGAALVIAEQLVREMNAKLVENAAQQGYARLTASGATAPAIPPEVVAHPLKGLVVDRAPVKPEMLIYFAPAVLALVLQHLGLTLTALSMVRERISGAIDVFRVAPIGTFELLLGKYIAYAVLSAVVATLVVAATTQGLGIPFNGSVVTFAVALALLTFASLGLGLFISLVSDSERQAVQLSMLVLLFSVFFSGFVLEVQQFREPIRALSYALPVTYGIAIFQDVMLRGVLRDPAMLGSLAAIGGVLFLLSAVRLRGVLRPA